MRGLILAAGRGRRMGHIGDALPKCLVELDGRPLLQQQVAALRRGGVQEIGLVRGYRAEMLEFPGFTYFENPRWQQTSMVASLAAAASWLRTDAVIVSYADIFYRGELVRRLTEAPGALVVAYDRGWRRLWQRRFHDPLSDAETFRTSREGELIEIGGRARRIEEIEGQYMGLLKFTPAAWRAVWGLLEELEQSARDHLDMTGLLRRLLATGGLHIGTLQNDGQWGEVDGPSDLELYQQMLAAGELELEVGSRAPEARSQG